MPCVVAWCAAQFEFGRDCVAGLFVGRNHNPASAGPLRSSVQVRLARNVIRLTRCQGPRVAPSTGRSSTNRIVLNRSSLWLW